MELDLFTILKHVINVVLLFVILRLLLYKPVVKFMNERAERIAKKLDDAEALSSEAQGKMDEYNQLMAGSKKEIDKMFDETTDKAAKQADQIVRDAEIRASEILRQAREAAQSEHDRIFAQMQGEVVDMAINIASKVLTREVTAKDNKAIIDKFFEKAV